MDGGFDSTLNGFQRARGEYDVAHGAKLGPARQFLVELATSRFAEREARLQPQRLDREAVLGALRLHVDAADEACPFEQRKDVIAVLASMARHVDFDPVVEAED